MASKGLLFLQWFLIAGGYFKCVFSLEDVQGLKTSGFPMYNVPPEPEKTAIAKSPPPFVHPRLFFVSEDLPEMRRLLLDPKSLSGWTLGSKFDAPVTGAGGYAKLKSILLGDSWNGDNGLSPLYKGPYKTYYDAMLRDSSSPGVIDLSPRGIHGKFGSSVYLHEANVADSGFGYKGVYGKLSGAAFVALVSENEPPFSLKELAKVLGSTCRHHRAKWVKEDTREFGFYHDSNPNIGTAYDWLYNEMSNSDREECRKLIAAMTGPERREFGAQFADFPWTGYNWNWVGWHETIVTLAASIEKETETWTSRWLEECHKVQSRYFVLESSEGGLAREGMGYHLLGMNGALASTVVVARSQENLFEAQKTREALYRMILYRIYSAVPWIDQGQPVDDRTLDAVSHGDQPGRHRPRWAIILRKYFPTDSLVGWALKTSDRNIYVTEPLMSAVFVNDGQIRGNFSTLEEIARTKKLPENYFCRDRGEMIVRDHWGADATMLDFEVKMNALSLGHNHADRNSFYLYSRGRAWIIDNSHGDVENIAHQTVLIDGIGQGGGSGRGGSDTFPAMPGIFMEYIEGTNNDVPYVSGVGDAKPAYDFTASCNSEAKEQGYQCVTSPYTVKDFSYPPAPYLNMPLIEGLTDRWMDDERGNYRLNRPILSFNPVRHAYRTTLFVKTKSAGSSAPFIIVADDIQKDDKPHKYDFIMNLPWAEDRGSSWQYRHELEQVVPDRSSSDLLDTKTNIILKDTRDPQDSGPRLLVRVLNANGMSADGPKFVDKVEFPIRNKMGGGKRRGRQLVITATSVSPEFRILLYPHEKGDPLPTTVWSQDHSFLTVNIPNGEKTVWSFEKMESGRTRVAPRDSGKQSQQTSPQDFLTTAVPTTQTALPVLNSTTVKTPNSEFGSNRTTPEYLATAASPITQTLSSTFIAATTSQSEHGTSSSAVDTKAENLDGSSISARGPVATDTKLPPVQSTQPSVGATSSRSNGTVPTSSALPTKLVEVTSTHTKTFTSNSFIASTSLANNRSNGSTMFQSLTTATAAIGSFTTQSAVPSPQSNTQPLGNKNIVSLRVVAAGKFVANEGTVLQNGSFICLTEFPKGFAVICQLPQTERDSVTLRVDKNAIRVEKYYPYCFGGDSGHGDQVLVKPWNPNFLPGKPVQLECESSDGYYASVVVKFECNRQRMQYFRYKPRSGLRHGH